MGWLPFWQEVHHSKPGLGAWYSSGEDWLVHVQAQKVVESAMPAGRTVPTVGSGVEVGTQQMRTDKPAHLPMAGQSDSDGSPFAVFFPGPVSQMQQKTKDLQSKATGCPGTRSPAAALHQPTHRPRRAVELRQENNIKSQLVASALDSMEVLVSVPQKAPWARVVWWVLVPGGCSF